METPSSTRRKTRSQIRAAALGNTNTKNIPISRKIGDSEKSVSNSRRKDVKQQKDRSAALIDITNDSPIVGLAMGGSLGTPSSAIAKQRSSRTKNSNTPGSGEALLRGQVRTLLQKVEEEAELSKLSLESRPFLNLGGFASSPMGLLAPTPANTPQVSNLSEDGDNSISGMSSVTPLPIIEEQLKVQVVSDILDGNKLESLESQKSLTRSLFLDFSEKSEVSDLSEDCSSVLTYQTGEEVNECTDKSLATTDDDDNASSWSLQGNVSTNGEDGEVSEGREEEDDGGLVDELAEGFSRISVNKNAVAKFIGKRTIFLYDSDDDEIVDKVKVEVEEGAAVSPSVTQLKGLPTPKGKHLRFLSPDEEEVC